MLFDSFINLLHSKFTKRKFKFVGIGSRINRLSLLVGAKYITIGDHTSIGQGSYLCAWDSFLDQRFTPIISIGNNVSIGHYCHITACNKISIGDGTLTGKWVSITDNSHGHCVLDELMTTIPTKRKLHSKGEVKIGKNVWIGDKVTILPGVVIGDGAIIGANAVVSKDIPQYTIAVGNPIKIIEPKK